MIPMLACTRRAAGISMLLFPILSFAAETPAHAAASPVAGTLQMLLGLGIVLAAIAGTAWLLRRMAPGQVGGAGNLRVVAGVAVGPKERVVLVDVGETRLVLGVATGQVNLLHQMPRPDDADQASAYPAMPPFVEKLKEYMAARQERK
ncbi:flagellar protein FliO/FliZ [Novimethylophilus kurashikiensis]|uniref:Flagellar protein n=1 Tax=Novimethylophilus kurashikiensis TaxID=1825523 RepID=A0A2R5F1J4_9PROT|nr:flagellar biosynthetic protein FliO [Novimethylophilus kurashikiensis]GBG12570.1 flagellar protein FliO/FliZ [Novimethylophilus kurashikiensis]